MRGASVHARNRANNTPLYLAEKMGNDDSVRLLREAGAHLWEAESSAKTSEAGEGTGHDSVEVDSTDEGLHGSLEHSSTGSSLGEHGTGKL